MWMLGYKKIQTIKIRAINVYGWNRSCYELLLKTGIRFYIKVQKQIKQGSIEKGM